MNQAIDFSTLTWVKSELDETLKQARQSLEAHVENPQDEAQLGFLAANLHQVYGTLQMVELYGASLLAEEMEHVAKAIADNSVSRQEDACEVLMRAILQLPDYLDRLIAGYRDIPLVLLPILNDLRAVRGENLLSENSMFSPDLNAELPDSLVYGTNEDDIRDQARDLRHRFQVGLLGWFRDNNTKAALDSMADVLESLQGLSSNESVAGLWWVAAGVVDALNSGALDNSASVKRLMGQLDRHIKRIIDEGEPTLAQDLPQELFKNLLFYVAQAHGAGSRVAEIQATYRLQELLPGEEELAAARESLHGQNADLFETVAVAVKEELGRLKDSLDIVLRNGCKELEELQPLISSLRSLGDTLGMLSLGAPRKAVISKADELEQYVDSGETPADTSLMDVASTLLFVESSVDGMGAGRAVPEGDGPAEEQLAQSEFDHVMDVVMHEAITDLIRAKEAVVAYTESDNEAEALAEVPQWFNQVKGGLLLLGETRAAALVDSIAKYIEGELIQQRKQASQHELDSLADAVCGLEYYLESRREHRMYGGSAMNVAEEGVEKLGYPPQLGELLDELDAVEIQDVSAPPENEAVDETVSLNDAQQEEMSEEVVALEPLGDVQHVDGEPEAIELTEPLELEDGGAPGIGLELDESQLVEGSGSEDQAEQLQEEAAVTAVESEEPSVDDSVQTHAEQLEDEDDGLAVLGEDIDEEILEIFIEEAEEEIASINEQLPAWISNSENSEALATVRRSYHTLKGSGRLLGAMRIGEFAWAFESMLNRVIDGTVFASPAMLDLLESASTALPELVQQVKDGTPTKAPIGYLMRCADALSKGEDLPAAAIAEQQPLDAAARQQVGDDVQEPQAESEPEQPALPAQDATVETALPEEIAMEAVSLDSDPLVDGVMDPMLYEIFNSETRGHLEVIRQFLGRAAAGDASIDEPVARALHTMHGSAHMAEADVIADLAGALEGFVKALMDVGKPMSEAGCRVLQDSAGIIEDLLCRLPDEIAEPDGYAEIMGSIRSLHEAVPLPADGDEISDAENTDTAVGGIETEEVQLEALVPDETPAANDDPYAECDQELLEVFLEESEHNLQTSGSALQRWCQSRDDAEAPAELQRAVHTLKGGARMADLPPIGDLAHAVESLLIAIDEGRSSAQQDTLETLEDAQGRLVSMLDDVREHRVVQSADTLISRLQELRERAPAEPEAPQEVAVEVEPVSSESRAEPDSQAETESATAADEPYGETDPELLQVFLEEAGDILDHSEETLQGWKQAPNEQSHMAELQRELHTLKGGARMADITEVGDLAHAVESLMVRITEGEIAAGAVTFDVLEQAHDRLVAMVDQVRRQEAVAAASELLRKLEMLRDGKEPVEHDEPAVEEQSGKSAEVVPLQADAEHRERRAKPRASQELVRVKANLLDNMVNYAGEVSIYRSRLEQQVGAYRFNLVEMEQTVSRLREQLRKLEIETEAQVLFRYEKEGTNPEADFDPLEMDRYSHMQQLSRSLVESVSDLSSIQNLLDNITRESETLLLQQSRVNTELQEGLMRTRMVPFLGLAARMRRIIRQTAQELGKKAELELSGAEGEMDRTVVDRIIAPIEHMLRNAISHGIESPQQRIAAGKPEAGTINITLERESSDVVLRIADDGAGISLEAIRNKAIERGLMEPNSGLTDNEVLQFILETGFSTAAKVTQVAGRGVGMDVVNSEVKQLGGSLHIDSEAGKGTTFTVRLPFTLALNQALLIEVGEDTYAIPLSSIEGIVRMRREDLKAYYDDPDARFDYGGFQYEVRHLGSLLGTGKPRLDSGPKRIPVLLARVSDHFVAFQVENLLGSREIVVKSVGPQISTVRGVSGATILGDGRVVMILDVAALLRGGVSQAMAQVEEMISQPRRGEGVTVMVVDDSITVRKVTTRLLERNDMNVISAKDGVDAVSKLQENIPDIMLLDIEMPRMDGFELATHVRNEARLRDIPIIMITSRTGDKHRQRAMQIGVNRYLGKPFQETDLLENIRALLEEQKIDG